MCRIDGLQSNARTVMCENNDPPIRFCFRDIRNLGVKPREVGGMGFVVLLHGSVLNTVEVIKTEADIFHPRGMDVGE
jgi:hypothetical protein